MPVIQTALLTPGQSHPQTQQIYNGLDCCITAEVFETLRETYGEPPQIYQFERALQGPYLEIMNRGFRVDDLARRQASSELETKIASCQTMLNEFADTVRPGELNPRSHKQLKEFFYESMHLPEVWLSQKGERKLSLNREALEKLDQYLFARPFVSLILRIRELAKQHEVLTTEIDPDGRFRTSYNIAGTETGRPSSSENAYGTGGNAQNVAPSLRYVFVADLGMRLCVIDLEQVEARDVGFFCGCLFNDWAFLDNCESGDLHTNNAKLIWPGLDWSNDPIGDRKVAERSFYRGFSYRDMSKRGGHLSNYMGTAWTASRTLKVPLEIMEEFQARYVRGRAPQIDNHTGLVVEGIEPAFPAIARYWQWVAQQLQTTHTLITPFGRKRMFFGRPNDDTTLREGIAYLPQSTTADRMNLGLWRVWRYMPECQLLAQTYDSITFQFSASLDENEVIGRALELLKVELIAPNGRRYTVPGEAKLGFNWGAQVTRQDQEKAIASGKTVPRLNPSGLIKFDPKKRDLREAPGLGLKRIAY